MKVLFCTSLITIIWQAVVLVINCNNPSEGFRNIKILSAILIKAINLNLFNISSQSASGVKNKNNSVPMQPLLCKWERSFFSQLATEEQSRLGPLPLSSHFWTLSSFHDVTHEEQNYTMIAMKQKNKSEMVCKCLTRHGRPRVLYLRVICQCNVTYWG